LGGENGGGALGLKAALDARLTRFADTQDPSEVLDPAALDQARRLLKAILPENGDPGTVPAEILATLAYLHLGRYQVLPGGQGQDGLRWHSPFSGRWQGGCLSWCPIDPEAASRG
jgi:hypothetical protein